MKKYLLIILPFLAIPLIVIGSSYTVKEGDMVKQIAKDLGVSNSDITGFQSGNPDLIFAGEKLNVKEQVLGGMILGAAPTTIVTNLQDNGLAGFGTRCVQTDNDGLIAVASSACGSGGGGGGGSNWATSTLLISPIDTTFSIGFGSTASSSKILLRPDGTAILNQPNNVVVKASGSMGIGIALPTAKLHVVGDSYLNGSSTIGTLYVVGSSTMQGLSFGVVKSSATGLLTVGTIGAAELSNADFGDFTCSAGVCGVDANAIALGTDTVNNYVATVADAGNSTITVSGSGSETAAVTLDVIDVNCTDCLNATAIEDIYVLNSGDTINGALTVTASTTFSGLGFGFVKSSAGGILTSHPFASLTADVSGILPVANGGTATSSIASANGLFISNGTTWQNSIIPNCDNHAYWYYASSTKTISCVSDLNSGTGGSGTPDGNDPFKWIASGANLTASSTYDTVHVYGTASSTQLRSSSSTLGTLRTLASSTFSSAGVSKIGYLDSNGVLTGINIGSNLSLSGDTLSATGGSGTADGNDPFKWIANATDLYASSTYTQIGINNSAPTAALHITGDFYVTSSSTLTGLTRLLGAVQASSTLSVTGQASFGAETQTTGNAKFLGAINGSSTLAITLGSTLTTVSSTNIFNSGNLNTGALQVVQAGSFGGPLSASSSLAVALGSTFAGRVNASTTLNVTGQTSLGAELAVSGAIAGLNTLTITSTSTLSAGLTITGPLRVPINPTLNTGGQFGIFTTSSTLGYNSGGINRGISDTDCNLKYSFGTVGNARGVVIVSPRAVASQSTVTNVYGVHGTHGDTATFNIFLSNNRSTATSSMRALFTSYQTITATTTVSSLTVNGSTTIASDDMLLIDFQPASSTDGSIVVCKRTNI